MKDQKTQQVGTPAESYHDPVDLFVAGFVGSPRMNFVQGLIVANGAGPAFTAAERRSALDGYRFASEPRSRAALACDPPARQLGH